MNPEEHHMRVSKRARYYTIGSVQDANDVWIVCHGYGQLAGRFVQSFASIAQTGRVIVAPEGLHRFYMDPPPAPAANRRVGATWMTREDRDSDIADYIDYLDQLISEILAQSPSARLRVLGFSQGSATILRWAVGAARAPHQLILWAGEVPTDVDWTMGARKLANTRIDAVRGNRDELTSQATLARNLATLSGVGLRYELHEFSGGHHINDELLQQLAANEL
jgi:predicted esterase